MMGYREAFSLSKDEVRRAEPPGTSKLIDHVLERTNTGTISGKHDQLVLVPQPSSDPADPLNWSAARKAGVLLVISLYPLFANHAASVFGPALPVLAQAFNPPESFSNLTHLIAVPVLLGGTSGLWWVPLANTYGRRPIMLVSLLIFTVCSIWCAEAKTFNSLLAARLFQGIGIGPSDTVCADIVGEVFFVHQRGRAMAIYTLFLALGTSAGGLSGSYTAANLGWRWTMWIAVILAGTNLVLAFFLLPETLFDRQSRLSREELGPSGSQSVDDKETKVIELEHGGSYLPYTFSRSLAIGVNRGGLGRQFLGPWLSLRFPGVWVVVLLYGGLVGGVVTIASVAPSIVAMPPYLWGEKSSLVSVGALVGAVLGAIYTYFTADRLMKRSAQSDELGLAEPESRLPTMIPALFMATTGLWVFGFCAQNPGPGRWIGLEFGFGMVNFGIMQAPSVGFNYIHDAYHSISGDAFVMSACFRSVISFAWTFFVGEWITKKGAAEPFGIFGMLMGLFSLLLIPQLIYGKRTRIATAKWLPEDSFAH